MESAGMAAKVAIAGAGMVGRYLHRLLQRSGISADLYGLSAGHGSCGIRPCGWGTSSEFPDLVRAAGLDPNNYVMRTLRTVDFDDMVMTVKLMTFNKPRLLRDLLGGAQVIEGRIPCGRYERIIDATGLARNYLPPAEDQIIIPCVQYRVRNPSRDAKRVVIKYGNIGYSWIFPLAGDEFHVGAGSVREDPRGLLEDMGFPDEGDSIICNCSSAVRTSSPDRCLPFVSYNADLRSYVWGVGEAVGTVGPITGEGVVPGMRSARVLIDNWDDPELYTSRLLKTFSWMAGERRAIDKVLKGERLSLSDWLVLRGSGKRMGSELSIGGVRSLLSCLSRFGEQGESMENEEAAVQEPGCPVEAPAKVRR